ncbi:helix-turn-helix transcriptional regulator [Paenibacillus sp. FSL H3-0469]|uniref:helix-turn-helix domain-containing protein n=1 Tax=Paenibacillus sp. FSL H3-0469 TaxID=2954506 RepID=UPI0031013AA5
MIYTNLSSEMERRGVTISSMSRELNMRRGTLSDKLHGKFRLHYDEALKIKQLFFSDCGIEDLFSTSEMEGDESGGFSNRSGCH